MNTSKYSIIGIVVFAMTALCVGLFAWYRFSDDETNVYLSYVNSYIQLPEFSDVVFVGVVDDCGFSRENMSDKIIKNLVNANTKDKGPSDLGAIAHIANVMKLSEFKTIDQSNGRLNIQTITGKNPIYLSRVAFDADRKVAIMCVSNGHTQNIVAFRKKNISEWVLAE